SSWRLGRQLALEALVVGLVGGVAALAFAAPAVAMLMRLAGDAVPLPGGGVTILAARVIVPLLAAALLTALASVALPALHSARTTRLASELQAGGARAGAGKGTRRLRGALVVAQVALSAMLLVGTFLLLRTLGALIAVPTGMSIERTVAFTVALPSATEG